MGLVLEVVSGRTLTIRGTKKVARAVQRANAVTHSLTVHIVLCADGSLLPKLPVVLYEPKVPQSFGEMVAPFKDLVCFSKPSGKMDSAIACEWLLDCFLPNVQCGSLLIIDGWTGFKQMKELPAVKENNLAIITLPDGSTPFLQPADVYFNRIFKNFVRVCSDRIRWKVPDYIISKRENLLALLELTYYMFKAERFKSFLQYSWFKTGIFPDRGDVFVTPVSFCLRFKPTKCMQQNCTSWSFMRCSWCETYRCFFHILHHRH